MRCCAHILNLIVKDGLGVVNDGVEKIWDSVAYWIEIIINQIPNTYKLSLF